jgi:arylsulfatase A-like enzyme
LWLILPSAARVCAAEPLELPNILLIVVDNVGYGDLRCYGNEKAKTPRIDRLAAEGVRCTDFYIASPSCSPSRGAILTGRHPLRNGLNHQLSAQENVGGEGLPREEMIIPQYLAALGYVSGAFGKWNIGFAPGSRPTDRGFDEFLGHMSGNIHYFKHLYHGANDMRRGTEPIDLQGQYSTDVFADAAIDFMRRHKDRPHFIYLPFNAVHFMGPNNLEPGEKPEWPVPEKYLAQFGARPDETDQQIRFLAVLAALDDAIGRVLATLDDLALRDKTLVVLLSDNGAFMLPGRGLEVQSNAPLRGGGVTAYEGGIRVPAIVRWPGHIKSGSVCSAMLSSLDLLPLAITAAGGQLPRGKLLDGSDPISALAGETSSPHDSLFWVWNQGRRYQWRAIRQGEYKLIRASDSDAWELYDVVADVGETKNLARLQPERVKKLANKFAEWLTAVQITSQVRQ